MTYRRFIKAKSRTPNSLPPSSFPESQTSGLREERTGLGSKKILRKGSKSSRHAALMETEDTTF